jgi:hypothetical protein
MAIGYAQCEFDQENNLYTIRQRDAHAWPEVYFPGLGWVEFEPTAGQPTIVRPSGEDAAANNTDTQLQRDFPEPLEERELPERDPALAQAQTTSRIRNIAVLAIAGAALAILAIPAVRRRNWFEKLPRFPIYLESGIRRLGLQPPAALRRWALQAALPPLSRAYMEINYALRRIGRGPHPTETPAERGRVLARAIPDAGGPTQRLIQEYQTDTYSPRPATDLEAARSASREIRVLSLRAMLRRALSRMKPQEKDLESRVHRRY